MYMYHIRLRTIPPGVEYNLLQQRGVKTYTIIMTKDSEKLEFNDTQFRPTDTIQEATVVQV
jgi:hypothetical protein